MRCICYPAWVCVVSLRSRKSLIIELNRLMADRPMRPRMKGTGSARGTELWFEPRRPEDLFAPLAQVRDTAIQRNMVIKMDFFHQAAGTDQREG